LTVAFLIAEAVWWYYTDWPKRTGRKRLGGMFWLRLSYCIAVVVFQ